MTNQPTPDNPDNTQKYEILYFLSITLDDEEVKNIKKKVSDIITKHNGTVTKEEEIGKRKLAYMIKRARHGHYIYTVFTADPNQVSNINRELELMPEILRFQLSIKEDIKKPTIDLKKPVIEKKPVTPIRDEQKKEDKKVDIQELDRKIDELLTDHDV